MNDREYFLTTSLSYQLQAARRELAGFRSGEAWQKMRAEILKAAQKYPATLRGASVHGSSYSQDVILYGLKGNSANVQIGWIVHPDGTLHLVTAHMEDL